MEDYLLAGNKQLILPHRRRQFPDRLPQLITRDSHMPDPVLVERRGTIALLTLNLPHKCNALSIELFTLLAKLLNELQDDMSVRALVLHGARHCSAGGDLDSLNMPPLAMRHFMQVGQRTVRALTGGRLPAIAAVEGNAYGKGNQKHPPALHPRFFRPGSAGVGSDAGRLCEVASMGAYASTSRSTPEDTDCEEGPL